MANNNLRTIKLGAPSRIVGGDAPNAEINVQVASAVHELTLKDGIGRCTTDGALKSAASILNKRLTEDVSEHDWYTPVSDDDSLAVDIQGNGTLTADEIDVFFQLLDKYTPDSNIEGHATAEAAYQDAVDALHERFPQFTIDVLKQFVRFKDKKVLYILLEHGVGANGGVTIDDIQNVKDLGTSSKNTCWFTDKSDIEYFDELSYFSGIKNDSFSTFTGNKGPFEGCTNLKEITIPPQITSIEGPAFGNHGTFYGCENLDRVNFSNELKYIGFNTFCGCNISKINSDEEGVANLLSVETLATGCLYNSKIKKIISNVSNINPLFAANGVYKGIIEEIYTSSKEIMLNDSFRNATALKKFNSDNDGVADLSNVVQYMGSPFYNTKINKDPCYLPVKCLTINLTYIHNNVFISDNCNGIASYCSVSDFLDVSLNNNYTLSRYDNRGGFCVIYRMRVYKAWSYTSASKTFVPSKFVEQYIADGNANVFPIGGDEWASTMRLIADKYAKTYAGWTDEQIANADYHHQWIDYFIMGLPKPDVNGDNFVNFTDSEVQDVLLANGVGSNGGITTEQLEGVTDIRKFFNGNTEIESFDEFSRTSVTSLSNYAFDGCSNLRSIKLPKTIFLNNGQHRCLFRGCTKLEGDFEIKVGENATHIDQMFSGTNIRSFSFAEGTILRDGLYFGNMFTGCPNLEYVDIRPLKVLPVSMFSGCTKLSEIKGIENVTVFEADCLKNTGINADCIKNNLIETWNTPGVFLSVFPNTLTHFGDNDPGYYYTYNHLIFKDGGDGDLDIVFSDFRTSGNVLLLDFPCNTKSLYFNARFMYRMNSNMCVVVRAVVPPTVIGDFNSRNFRYIFVPNESVDDYKSDVFWSSYADKIHAIGGAEWITEYESSDVYASYSKFGVR